MAVIRTPLPHSSFTMLRNCWLRDPRVSYKAKGLLGYLMSHADGYRVSQAQIVRESADGRDAVVSGLRELEVAGYLTRQANRTGSGRYGEDDYALADPFDADGQLIGAPRETRTPDAARGGETRHNGKPDTGNPTRETPPIEEHLEQTKDQTPAAVAAGDTEPPPSQRARTIAAEHHDAVGGMAPFMGVVKVVERALTVIGPDGVPRYSDERVAAALATLREAGRPVTLQTLHAALETPQAVGARRQAGPYRDPDPAEYGRF